MGDYERLGQKDLKIFSIDSMLKVHFKYDLDKDVDNFLLGTRSVNNSTPTKLQRLYIEKHGNAYSPETVRIFIKTYAQDNRLNLSGLATSVERGWLPIEESFISRTEKLFGLKYPVESIIAYLSINSRCTYNIQDGYFFVFMNINSSNAYIMHELLHFYTWHAFHDELMGQGIVEKQYNDCKESLTELLNLEYVDLMRGVIDDGYAQHAEMRKKVRELWLATKDVRKTIFGIALF